MLNNRAANEAGLSRSSDRLCCGVVNLWMPFPPIDVERVVSRVIGPIRETGRLKTQSEAWDELHRDYSYSSRPWIRLDVDGVGAVDKDGALVGLTNKLARVYPVACVLALDSLFGAVVTSRDGLHSVDDLHEGEGGVATAPRFFEVSVKHVENSISPLLFGGILSIREVGKSRSEFETSEYASAEGRRTSLQWMTDDLERVFRGALHRLNDELAPSHELHDDFLNFWRERGRDLTTDDVGEFLDTRDLPEEHRKSFRWWLKRAITELARCSAPQITNHPDPRYFGNVRFEACREQFTGSFVGEVEEALAFDGVRQFLLVRSTYSYAAWAAARALGDESASW